MTALTYALGFITVSANLASFGVQAFQPFRLQYILAGALVLLILAAFLLSVGLRVYLHGDRLTSVRLELALQVGGIWARLAWLFLLSEIAFYIVIDTLLLGPFLFGVEYATSWGVIWTLFIFDFLNSTLKVPTPRDRKWQLVASIVIQVGSVFYFFQNIHDEHIRALFWGFVSLAVTIAFIFRNRNAFRQIAAYHVAVGIFFVALVWSGYYGSELYKFTRPVVGGGKPIVARLLVTEEARGMLGGVISVEGNQSEDVLILGDSGDELLVVPVSAAGITAAGTGGPIVRINKALLRGSVAKR